MKPSITRRRSATLSHERTFKGKDTIPGGRGKQGKPSYLEVLVDGLVAKLVKFKGAFLTGNVALKPLDKFLERKTRPRGLFRARNQGKGLGKSVDELAIKPYANDSLHRLGIVLLRDVTK